MHSIFLHTIVWYFHLAVNLLKVNLVGGYYDAGDNLKFGLPMAFTTTLLAWSVIEFGSSMQNQLENARAAVRWGSDYLLKAATATPDTLYVQVRANSYLKLLYFYLVRLENQKISCHRNNLGFLVVFV